MKYRFGKKEYDFDIRTYVMGILNITPDSFSDGGKFFGTAPEMKKIIESAVQMEKDGADFIDVGGESTRPGADEVSLEQEMERVIPVISEITKRISIPVSIDTYKHQVADEALKAGAVIVNDISGFQFDDKIAYVTKNHNASCILMHIKGTPKNMQNKPVYTDVISEIITYLEKSVSIAKEAGIEQIILDPGIGFGKTFEDNLKIIKNLKEFKNIGYPILLGASRKSFINKIYESSPAERLEGTLAVNTAGIIYGANIIRVHDVLENKRAALTADNLK
ncbi:MAG: dihydropteroate synthase [Ignavibacteria bacterium]|nr:dihydropteroate synthase [Ignavibacteria bacterium]